MVLSGYILPLLGRFLFPQTKAGTTYSVQLSFLYLCSAEPGSIVWFTSRLYFALCWNILQKQTYFCLKSGPLHTDQGPKINRSFFNTVRPHLSFECKTLQDYEDLWRQKNTWLSKMLFLWARVEDQSKRLAMKSAGLRVLTSAKLARAKGKGVHWAKQGDTCAACSGPRLSSRPAPMKTSSLLQPAVQVRFLTASS